MPQETQLQIDDGTTVITAQLQCATCETNPYLDHGEKTVIKTVAGDLWEYPYTCPTCKAAVFVRVPHVGSA